MKQNDYKKCVIDYWGMHSDISVITSSVATGLIVEKFLALFFVCNPV